MKEYIIEILQKINTSIEGNIFVDVENSNIELKDLSTGMKWDSLKETVCAFLNTNGGYVICGVREKNKKYHFTGFNRDNENNLRELQNKTFQNDKNVFIELTDFIQFDYISFRTGEVAVIVINPLRDDLKYVKYNGKYYERKLTGDHEIVESRITQQKEYKLEIEYAKELTLVEGAKIEDLSFEKVNQYINTLNQSSRKETLKSSIQNAKQFLEYRHFIKSDKVTTLGMLVCGDNPFHFLEYRSEVDCNYDSSSSISKDKKDFQNDVLSLMKDTFDFVWGHIRKGRVTDEGGKTVPEYSEELIREMINNSLAHRDYTINKFVTVNIEPGQYLQIKNPGVFKERIKVTNTETEVPVRRLIPGIPESKNPKLASVLKAFDKIESQGRGMSTLVAATLHNQIDIPYYELKDDETISLTIPSGKLLDEESKSWINSFEKYISNKLKDNIKEEHKLVLSYFRKSELLNRKRLYTLLLSESNNHFAVLEQLKKSGLIYEHIASTENTPIYVLDRQLMKENFSDELISLIGNGYISYDSVTKNILNALYRYTFYNEQPIKPSTLTSEIYYLEYGKNVDPKKYETLGRKLRSICKKLNLSDILIKHANAGYTINQNHVMKHKLF